MVGGHSGMEGKIDALRVSTRSVGLNLAWRFNAGSESLSSLVASATAEIGPIQAALTRRRIFRTFRRALKSPAKFRPDANASRNIAEGFD
jgi:hypothetical protein